MQGSMPNTAPDRDRESGDDAAVRLCKQCVDLFFLGGCWLLGPAERPAVAQPGLADDQRSCPRRHCQIALGARSACSRARPRLK